MTEKRKSDLKFWIVVGAVLGLSFGLYFYANHRIAKEQERQDAIADQFIYTVDQETGRKQLVPRHPDWKSRIEKINAK